MLDTGVFLLSFTQEEGGDKVRNIIERHEAGDLELFIHPNNLVEAYKVINIIEKEKPGLIRNRIPPEEVIRSAYATLSVIQDERTTLNLGILRTKYHNKPWGDLSAAAVAMSLSDGLEDTNVPVLILEHEKHFGDINEITAWRLSQL
ncbi:MAG: hypothetical protein OK457_10060 [Thaumarchaeota archaeon]|nr:hypothetical protein [Nitrososphaerota archaeon]